jgi:exopolysaccharide biosynthesis polyprenyl glycosylphosphotransferase
MISYSSPSEASRPVRPAVPAAAAGITSWERAYSRSLVLVDGSLAVVGGVLGYLIRPGIDRADWTPGAYGLAILMVPAGWLATVLLAGGYDLRHLGEGWHDLRSVLLACLAVLSALAWLAWTTPLHVPRGYVLLTLLSVATSTLAGRAWMRHGLRLRRRRGEWVQRVLAVGQCAAVAALAEQFARSRGPAGVLVGCCVPGRAGTDAVPVPATVPVFGGIEDVTSAVAAAGADTVAVLPCPELSGPVLRRLAWALEGRVRHLVLVPGLTEVAFPRLSLRPVCDLPALHVRHPRLSGPGWFGKAMVDRLVALVALVVLAPVLLCIGIAVRATSPGPALFRQTRVGRHGRPFTFLKFRTMCFDAERYRDTLEPRNINGDGPLFKLREDPRVTRLGAVLRRWSLDELPQLVNVLIGQMSLVGPRPPLPQEVARYSADTRRRLLVRPGLTGLWQVSGRSDLPWEDAVRLDLRYVDNWSPALDLTILFRTFAAVLHRAGAY